VPIPNPLNIPETLRTTLRGSDATDERRTISDIHWPERYVLLRDLQYMSHNLYLYISFILKSLIIIICDDCSNCCVFAKVDIGYGVMVPAIKIELIRSNRATQMTHHLMDITFRQQEIAAPSVTGRSSNKTGGPPKPALDQAKVAALLGELYITLYMYHVCAGYCGCSAVFSKKTGTA